jgi:hypothetical protein
MHAYTIAQAGLLAFAASADASSYLIKNFCTVDLYLTPSNPSGTNATGVLPDGHAYEQNITGQANSIGVTKGINDYWASNGNKTIFGTSTELGTLWWSLSEVVGDPFYGQSFNVSSNGTKEDICGHTTNYTTPTQNCADDGVVLTLNLCSVNA